MEDDYIISEPELNNIQEEEYDSEEELMPTLLPVEGNPNAMDLEKVPENANEYLLQVRAQAARLQTNTVATHLENTVPHKISNNYLPNSYLLSFFQKKSEAPKLPLASLTPEYRTLIIQSFQQIKDATERARKTKLDLHMICNFSKQAPTTLTPKFLDKKSNFMAIFKEANGAKQTAPSIDLLIHMDLVLADKIIDWICDEIYDYREKKKLFTPFQCLWIFTILTIFEKPLLPDTCAWFNDILTFMIQSLETLESQQTSKDEKIKNTRAHEAVAVIIIDYFEQRYLA